METCASIPVLYFFTEHHLYRAIAYFLASRATLDLADIPLYRTFLLSSGDQVSMFELQLLKVIAKNHCFHSTIKRGHGY